MLRMWRYVWRHRFVAGLMIASSLIVLNYLLIKYNKKTRTTPIQDCKSWKKTSQHKTTLITKTACGQHYFLLIVVSSAPAHFERRNLIRQTWGTDSTTNNNPLWRTFFLLGQTKNQTQSSLIEKEEKDFGDIIQGDYYEHYWNQSFKVEMGFEWAARYCSFSFLLKADDDVLVNTKDLVLHLQQESTPKERLYMGKVQVNAEVRRYGKFNISFDEFAGSTYPNYCSGAGFVLSYDVVECLVPIFDVIKPFRIDDTYVGILVNQVGITPVHHSGFVFPGDYYDDCYFVPKTLIQHRAIGPCLIKLYSMHSKRFYDVGLGSYY